MKMRIESRLLPFNEVCPICGRPYEIAARSLSEWRIQHVCSNGQLRTTQRWYPSERAAGNAYFKKTSQSEVKAHWNEYCIKNV